MAKVKPSQPLFICAILIFSFQLAWWMQILYLLSVGLVKQASVIISKSRTLLIIMQSILLFYQRISSSCASKPFHLFVLGMRIFQITTTTVWFFLTVFSCSPASTYWKRFNEAFQSSQEHEKFQCNLAGPTVLITMSIISIVQDFICAALPFLIIYRLKVPRRQRIAIFVIFFFAFAACIVAGTYAGWYLAWTSAHIALSCAM